MADFKIRMLGLPIEEIPRQYMLNDYSSVNALIVDKPNSPEDREIRYLNLLQNFECLKLNDLTGNIQLLNYNRTGYHTLINANLLDGPTTNNFNSDIPTGGYSYNYLSTTTVSIPINGYMHVFRDTKSTNSYICQELIIFTAGSNEPSTSRKFIRYLKSENGTVFSPVIKSQDTNHNGESGTSFYDSNGWQQVITDVGNFHFRNCPSTKTSPHPLDLYYRKNTSGVPIAPDKTSNNYKMYSKNIVNNEILSDVIQGYNSDIIGTAYLTRNGTTVFNEKTYYVKTATENNEVVNRSTMVNYITSAITTRGKASVGQCYIQFPNQPAPATIFGGTWVIRPVGPRYLLCAQTEGELSNPTVDQQLPQLRFTLPVAYSSYTNATLKFFQKASHLGPNLLSSKGDIDSCTDLVSTYPYVGTNSTVSPFGYKVLMWICTASG